MSVIGDVKLIEFSKYGDNRGQMVVIEGNKDIPFNVERVFFIYGSDSTVIRGQHANKKTEFVLINVSGNSKVKVLDGCGNEEVFILDRPYMGIYLPRMTWKDMYEFSSNSVLLVLASEHYDANEYIRDYEEFEQIVCNLK